MVRCGFATSLLAVCIALSVQCTQAEVQCEKGLYPPPQNTSLPWFEIKMETAARHRWDQIIETYNDTLNGMIDHILGMVNLIDDDGILVDIVDYALPLMLVDFPHDYRMEIIGISEKSKIPVGRVVLYNIFYEIFSVCTSIVAENGETGEHLHARNLDFGLFMGWDFHTDTWRTSEFLRDMMFNVDFTQNGQTVFKQVSFAGYIGTLTGVKPGSFSISLNERFVWNGGLVGLLEWFLGNKELKFASWVVRDALASNSTYDQAVQALSDTELIAPVYYIISGTQHNQGEIITRSHTKSLQPLQLDSEIGRWYLLETNYDHWKKPFFLDNRRIPGEKCMNESSYDTIDESHLFNVLSTDPVLNKLTVYTALMNVETGELQSYRQNCPSCYIW